MLFPKLPPLTGLVVNLEFLRATEFNVFHEMAIDAFLRHMLNIGQAYSEHLSIIAPENGRLHYRQGDPYRFVILMQGSEQQLMPYWQKIINQLRALPESAPVKDQGVPLKDNVKLTGLQDLFDGIPVGNEKSLDSYGFKQAQQQAHDWYKAANLQHQPITLEWSWQSISRILKQDHKYLQNELRFCRDNLDITPNLLLKRVFDTFANLENGFGYSTPPETRALQNDWLEQQSEFIEIHKPDHYWLDTPYFGKSGKSNTLGGLTGHFKMTLYPGIEPELLSLLIMGELVGIGQRRTSGFGKYRIHRPFKEQSLNIGLEPIKLTRAQPLSHAITQPQLIAMAIEQIEQKPNIDQLTERTHSQINSALGQIRNANYHPPSLQGFTIPKSDGEQRMLAVSPLYDRILQKAAALFLTPGLDAIMGQGSYGYRKGLSRQQVRYEIQNAYRQGYKWVYESDIEDFFDSIDRPQLIGRLESLFGEDPLWSLLENWLNQNIRYQDTIIERQHNPKGIPQGSPLSPLLANYILDDFDSDLELHGFKMIRFADDFIILCKNIHQAELAAKGVEYSLSQVKLDINRDKTHIVSMEQGFRFLGYLFREDHAIEIAGQKSDGTTTFTAEDLPKSLPPWLANMGTKPAKPISDEDSPNQQIGELEEQGLHLVLAGDAQILTTDNHHLVVKKEDAITHKVSWEQLHAITLIGLHTMTLPAQHQALRNKIPVHMADRTGQYLGALTSFKPAQNNYKNWFIQLQMSDRHDFTLQIAKNIVNSRIHNQRQTLFKRKAHRKELQAVFTKLKNLSQKVEHAEKLSSLNGYEGTAAREYFACFNLFLPEWAQFEKRTRRPPKDPFNVLLSLGYTVLYSHVDSILQAAGFMTWKGVYHQQSAAHAALASDIMETYRHLVERFAIYAINHSQIKQDDFRYEKNQNGTQLIRLSAEARRRYITGLMNRFVKFNKQHTLHQHLYQQSLSLKQAMNSQKPSVFQAWKELK